MRTSESFIEELARAVDSVVLKYNGVIDRLAVSQDVVAQDVVVTLLLRDMTDEELRDRSK